MKKKNLPLIKIITNKKKIHKYESVIICGGFGTRLSKISNNKPKCLVALNKNDTILSNIIENLKANHINSILILGHYKADKIIKYISKKYDNQNLNISIFIEKKPLGDFGAILFLRNYLKENFFYILGDIFIKFNFSNLRKFHYKNKSDLTLVTHKNNHFFDSDKIIIDHNNLIKGFRKKNLKNQKPILNLVNSGIAMINKKLIFKESDREIKINLIDFLFKRKIFCHFKLLSYFTSEFIEDIGTPHRLTNVKKYLKYRYNLNSQNLIMLFIKNFNFINLSNKKINLIAKANILYDPVIILTDFRQRTKLDIKILLDNFFARYNLYFDNLFNDEIMIENHLTKNKKKLVKLYL